MLGIIVFTIMRTWRHGRNLVREQINRDSLRIEHFVKSIMVDPPVRVPGTAIFMTPSNDYLPPSLLHNLKHNKVLHSAERPAQRGNRQHAACRERGTFFLCASSAPDSAG